MKTTTILLSLSFLVIQLIGFSQNSTAIEYNDKIISEQTKIILLTLEMNDYLETDLVKCEEIRVEIIKQCESSIGVVQKMSAFEGNSDLKNAAVNLFTFYKETYTTEFLQLIEILNKGELITDDDIIALTEISELVANKEIPIDAAFEKAQNEFAERHNFVIEENELQQEIDEM